MKNSSPSRSEHPASGKSSPVQARGAQARQQLLVHATRIFAGKGYTAASTREICEAAGVNLTAIRYYFGNKEGLYRAALIEPIQIIAEQLGGFDAPSLSFSQALQCIMAPLLGMTQESDYELRVTRLHLRETLEPSVIFREVVQADIRPLHNKFTALLAKHCNLERADTDIHQLAFAMLAMANDYCISREYMKLLAPEMFSRPDAEAIIFDRLTAYCCALLDNERERRRALLISSRARADLQDSQ